MAVERETEILNALRQVRDPDLGRDIVSLGFVKNLHVADDNVVFTIELTTPACPVRDKLKEEARSAVLALPGFKNVEVTMTAQVRSTPSEKKEKIIPAVKNIVPVASGKGGVGKSTISANLAVALAQLGAQVGLMDADVYGPSIPTIMGVKQPPQVLTGNRLIPSVEHGVKIISMGFFVRPGDAVIWRGPMLHKTIEQFLANVEWGELDYLIVDLPPGTGDIQLSLCQLIPLTGAAVVSTPQDVAMQVAEKAIIMFGKLNTPVLGLIENMSGFVCPHCGAREEIFGSGGTRAYSLAHDIPFLGEIPLATEVRQTSDSGRPIVIAAPDSPAAKAFARVAQNLAAQVSIQNLGGGQDERPIPMDISQPTPEQTQIIWKDGHQSRYAARDLRLACLCALCVDEVSRKPLLRAELIPKVVHPKAIHPVGRYAVRFEWSDGHSTGIYTYDYLRSLCPCGKCATTRIA